jgi:dsRNA-specific ribonuclease
MLRVKLNVQENETIQMVLKYKKIPVKTSIPLNDIQEMIEKLNIPDSLDINLMLLDKSRIHPRYTKVINRYCEHSMTSYSALSYIGDAFVNFVASILMYHEYGTYYKGTDVIYPLCSSGMLSELSNQFKCNTYLAKRTKELGWDKHLLHNQKEIKADTKKGEKAYADMMEGFIGCLYSSNGMDKILEVCEVVKHILMPESDISFVKKTVNHVNTYAIAWVSFITGMLCGFGSMYIAEWMN